MHIFTQPPKMPNDKDIFIDDVDKLVEQVYPNSENQHPLFKKVGFRINGIGDHWIYTKDWKQLNDTEKWKYVALCSLYQKRWLQYWIDRDDYEKYKEELNELGKENPHFLNILYELESQENKEEINE